MSRKFVLTIAALALLASPAVMAVPPPSEIPAYSAYITDSFDTEHPRYAVRPPSLHPRGPRVTPLPGIEEESRSAALSVDARQLGAGKSPTPVAVLPTGGMAPTVASGGSSAVRISRAGPARAQLEVILRDLTP